MDGVTKFDALAGRSNEKVSVDGVAENGQALGEPPSLVDKRRVRTETVHKMLLAMADDPRVVVLKLADRLHNMRTLSVMSVAQQQNTARETNEIYAPLARRLGMALLWADLEDMVFSYLEPEKYARLSHLVEEEIERRMPFVRDVYHTLQEEMQRAGIHAEIVAWQKHMASINRKIEEMPTHFQGNELSHIHEMV